jgi:enoyl-CoA hydratase
MSLTSASVANGVGDIVLNRPKALNALDQAMIDELYPVLLAWADDPDVETVLVTSGIDRAFCAGGDIRAIRDATLIGDTAAITQYFSSEYTLDQLIADYPKPYVALIDGAAMGGGLGISVHGEVRVVTEKALIAMPETAIGFFPDIGSTYFLPRLPVGVGKWLGLTGARIRGTQAIEVGLATHSVASESVGALADAIRSGMPLGEALGSFDSAPAADALPLRAIADYFGGNDEVSAILGGLRGGDEWARDTAALTDSCSPTSLLVTAEMIDRGAQSSLGQCLDRELRAAEQITTTHDFAEGVRAVLVDKDRSPNFDPPTIDDVDPAVVARIVGDR